MTKEITHKFVDFFGMSFNDLFESEKPNLKYVEIEAPEDAEFAFCFHEFLAYLMSLIYN